MRSVKVYEEAWPLHTPFVISRGSRNEARVVVVECEEDGVKGVGECTPYPRYGESLASVMAQIMTVVPDLQTGLRVKRSSSAYRLAQPAMLSTVLSGALRRRNSAKCCLHFLTLRFQTRSSPRKR